MSEKTLLFSGVFFREVPMKKIPVFLMLFLGAVLLVSLAVSTDGSRAADDSKITVVYSGNILGYTEPCG